VAVDLPEQLRLDLGEAMQGATSRFFMPDDDEPSATLFGEDANMDFSTLRRSR
jgi:hypothetical protein